MMDLLAFLVVLVVGVILGYWLKNPVLVDRERAVGQKLRRAKVMLADAEVKMQIADGQLRLVQAVRRQTDEMLEFASRAPELSPATVALERSPVFDSMHGWLASTGAMPMIGDEPEEPPKPKRKRKVTVDVGGDVRAELVAS